jgi:SAM-dependent methyltransferase
MMAPMGRINDADVVRAEYATATGLAGRRAAYFSYPTTGPQALEIALSSLREIELQRILEVGCGFGDFALTMRNTLSATIVAVDLSPAMVALTTDKGILAQPADVQALPFEGGAFDAAVAAWMLYHVPNVDQAMRELHRTLRDGGRLVAITNASDHLHELRELVGLGRRLQSPFSAENGKQLLLRHFRRVEVHDAGGTIEFPDRAAVTAYVEASGTLAGARPKVPAFEGSLVVTRHPVVFVADK